MISHFFFFCIGSQSPIIRSVPATLIGQPQLLPVQSKGHQLVGADCEWESQIIKKDIHNGCWRCTPLFKGIQFGSLKDIRKALKRYVGNGWLSQAKFKGGCGLKPLFFIIAVVSASDHHRAKAVPIALICGSNPAEFGIPTVAARRFDASSRVLAAGYVRACEPDPRSDLAEGASWKSIKNLLIYFTCAYMVV